MSRILILRVGHFIENKFLPTDHADGVIDNLLRTAKKIIATIFRSLCRI